MPAPHLVGIYSILTTLPIWATAMILFFGTLGVLHAGREYFEGIPYQVSYSAMFGDALLFGVVLIAATILQRGDVIIPQKLQDVTLHVIILIISLCIGILASLFTLGGRSGKQMDVYHDVAIAPAIIYMAATLLPVIYYNGTTTEKIATICAIIIWAALVVFDIKTDRMNQRRWLRERGVPLL